MSKKWAAAVLLSLSSLCCPQGARGREVVRPPAPPPISSHHRNVDKRFIGLMGMEIGAGLIDYHRTMRFQAQGWVERDWVYGPHPSMERLYGEGLLIDGGAIAVGYVVRRYAPKCLRKYWWVPMVYQGLDHVRATTVGTGYSK